MRCSGIGLRYCSRRWKVGEESRKSRGHFRRNKAENFGVCISLLDITGWIGINAVVLLVFNKRLKLIYNTNISQV